VTTGEGALKPGWLPGQPAAAVTTLASSGYNWPALALFAAVSGLGMLLMALVRWLGERGHDPACWDSRLPGAGAGVDSGLVPGQNCPILRRMTGSECIHRVQRYAKSHGLPCRVDRKRGKGSHGTLYLGTTLTIVRNPKDELKTGTLHAMLKQLGLTLTDL
jgi:mRNA interferase HicA